MTTATSAAEVRAPIRYVDAHEELFRDIEQFLAASSDLYPGIDEWWRKKVIRDLAIGRRFCKVALAGERIAALSIGRYGTPSAKLCTLRVGDGYQGNGIGQHLLHHSLAEFLVKGCSRVHYTISEDILTRWGQFFCPYGFEMSSWARNRYVHGMDELIYSVDAQQLLRLLKAVRSTQISGDFVLISIKPGNAKLIEQGVKLVEYRRRFSPQLANKTALFYISSPIKACRFVAQIARVVRDTPESLWRQFGHLGGATKAHMKAYFGRREQGYALVLSDIHRLSTPLRLTNSIIEGLGVRPPQSFRSLTI